MGFGLLGMNPWMAFGLSEKPLPKIIRNFVDWAARSPGEELLAACFRVLGFRAACAVLVWIPQD